MFQNKLLHNQRVQLDHGTSSPFEGVPHPSQAVPVALGGGAAESIYQSRGGEAMANGRITEVDPSNGDWWATNLPSVNDAFICIVSDSLSYPHYPALSIWGWLL